MGCAKPSGFSQYDAHANLPPFHAPEPRRSFSPTIIAVLGEFDRSCIQAKAWTSKL